MSCLRRTSNARDQLKKARPTLRLRHDSLVQVVRAAEALEDAVRVADAVAVKAEDAAEETVAVEPRALHLSRRLWTPQMPTPSQACHDGNKLYYSPVSQLLGLYGHLVGNSGSIDLQSSQDTTASKGEERFTLEHI